MKALSILDLENLGTGEKVIVKDFVLWSLRLEKATKASDLL